VRLGGASGRSGLTAILAYAGRVLRRPRVQPGSPEEADSRSMGDRRDGAMSYGRGGGAWVPVMSVLQGSKASCGVALFAPLLACRPS
jgi:hypothetical protein